MTLSLPKFKLGYVGSITSFVCDRSLVLVYIFSSCIPVCPYKFLLANFHRARCVAGRCSVRSGLYGFVRSCKIWNYIFYMILQFLAHLPNFIKADVHILCRHMKFAFL
jgi:hypothetical protein